MTIERPKVGVGVIVRREDGNILIGRRIGAHGAHTWSFLGGHLEFGETPEACAARESMEEAGIVIGAPRFVGVTNDVDEVAGKHYVTLFYLCEHDGSEPQLTEPDKRLEWEWHPWDALPRPLFLPIENLISQGFHPNHYPVLTAIGRSATLASTFSP